MISRTTTHLFQPLLYQVATGILSEGEIAPTTRLVLRNQKNVRVRLGEVEGIDLQAKTATSKLMSQETVTPYDSLIVAAGAQQVLLGQRPLCHLRASGMKTIDDALELRGRILGAFEAAEVVTDHAERERRLTFVVVGAGPTGVELAGQIAELVERTLAGAFRSIRPEDCRVILLDTAPAVLPPIGRKLGLKAQKRLEQLGVEIQLNAMVTNVDYMGITVKDKDGSERRIDCDCKVWSAGVQASPLGKLIAEQSDGSQTDRAGRVVVESDLTVKGYPYVFVVGDLMAVPDVPGMAQGAIQGAAYATDIIKRSLERQDDPANREPFRYWDKGSMATVSRFDAVAQVPIPKSSRKLEFGGPVGMAGVAGAAPGLPGRLQESVDHTGDLVHHLPRPRPGPDGHHQPDDLCADRDAGAAEQAGAVGSGRSRGQDREGRIRLADVPATPELSVPRATLCGSRTNRRRRGLKWTGLSSRTFE